MTQGKSLYLLSCLLTIQFSCKQSDIQINLISTWMTTLFIFHSRKAPIWHLPYRQTATQLIVDLHGTLWLCSSTGGQLESLTEKTMDARQPHWSADGSQCTFQGFEEGNWHIYIHCNFQINRSKK